jgi:hypothetical protein
MDDAVIEYHDEDTQTVFRWHGGAYIDVGSYGDAGTHGIDGDDFHAYDVLNVWDHDANLSRFEVEAETKVRPFRWILEAFEDRCREYLAQGEGE